MRCSTRLYVYCIFAPNPIDKEGLFNFNSRTAAIFNDYAASLGSINHRK